ncbi:MAG: STAS domain-containing protein [Pirellulaceae bacterium]
MIDFSTHTTDNGTLVIRIGGSLDAENTEYFFDCVQDEIERGHDRIVINCADLGFISSVGLGSLIRARSRVAKTGGEISFARIDARILDVMRLTRLDKVFSIYPTEKEAVAAMEA